MRVYLAAQYSRKEDMKQVARELNKAGITCISSWLQEPHAPDTTLGQCFEEDLRDFAERDKWDIRCSDIFVLFSVDPLLPTVRGGRHVEMGYAMGLEKPIFVVGPKENIFHYLPDVEHFTCVSELISAIKEREVK